MDIIKLRSVSEKMNEYNCYSNSVFNKRLIYGDSIEELKLYKEVEN